jgi:hypothetical protein
MKDFKVSSDGWVTHDLVSEQLSRIPGVREGAEQQRQIFSRSESTRLNSSHSGESRMPSSA